MLAGANADLRGQLSGAQAALRAKEAEYNTLVLERDRLAKKLADQEESQKVALKKAQDSEDALKTEFETEAAGWAEAKQALSEGFGWIEDLIDGKPPSSLPACPLIPDLCSDLCCFLFFVQTTSLATPSSPPRPSRPTTRRAGRRGLKSRRTQAGRSRSSSWQSKPGCSRLTVCSAASSTPGRRCWPPSGQARRFPAPRVGLPTGWRLRLASSRPRRHRQPDLELGGRWSSSEPGIRG